MQNIKYSIVLPIYNMEKYLERCVNSILAQYPRRKASLEQASRFTIILKEIQALPLTLPQIRLKLIFCPA